MNSNTSLSLSSQTETETETTDFMDGYLYKAAVNGEIEAFSDYKRRRLDCLLTPNKNTVLHVYLANNRIGVGVFCKWFVLWGMGRWGDSKLIKSPKFVEHVLHQCPSLLLKPNAKGEIPLHIEAKFGHLPIIQLLITHASTNEADANDQERGQSQIDARQMLKTTDNEGNMALHIAARYGHVEVARRLIEEDSDFEYPPNKTGETPLFTAARRGYHRLVAEILDNSRSVSHGGPNGTNALHAAVMASSETTIKVLLKKKKHLAKEVDDNGRTPLHYASHLGPQSLISFGCTPIVTLLLGSDIIPAAYVKDKDQEMTPLLMAARQGHAWIMKEIIKHCPDCCELVDKRGWNFLHFAVVSLNIGSVREFLGAQEFRNFIDDKDIHGNTPLHVLANSRFYMMSIAEGYKHDKLKVTLGQMELFWNFTALNSSKKQEKIFKVLEEIGHGEVAGASVLPLRTYKIDPSRIDKARETNSVLAALIATITFVAVFQVPGGYNSEKGRDQGSAILVGNPAFAIFIISDAIALISSLLALGLYLLTLERNYSQRFYSYVYTVTLIILALAALAVAFVTGMYVVLQPCLPLAVVICIIGLSFFPCYFWLSNGLTVLREGY